MGQLSVRPSLTWAAPWPLATPRQASPRLPRRVSLLTTSRGGRGAPSCRRQSNRELRKDTFWGLRRRGKARCVIPRQAKLRFSVRRFARLRFSVRGRGQNALFRHVAAAREVWGNPPARLRGTMENASTGQMRSSNPPPGCGAGCAGVRRSRFGVWPHGKAHSAQPVGFRMRLLVRCAGRMRFSVRQWAQNALFRETSGAECAFA